MEDTSDLHSRAWVQLAEDEGKSRPLQFALKRAEGMKNDQVCSSAFVQAANEFSLITQSNATPSAVPWPLITETPAQAFMSSCILRQHFKDSSVIAQDAVFDRWWDIISSNEGLRSSLGRSPHQV